MSRREGFLDRWSRLKETGEAPEVDAPIEAAPKEAAEVDERSDEDILAELGLTHPDDLKPGDDVTGFMAKAVPDRLRRVALRKLWRSNPVLANLDGLNDYDDDFTSPELTQKVLATGYQVGRGFVKKVLDVEDEPETDVLAEAEPAPEVEDTEPAEIKEVSALESADSVAREADEETAFRPRRMRFET